jgi:hypothetical protein
MNETVKARVEQLKLMNELVFTASDEYIHDTWLMLGIPDGSTEADYIDYAEDDETYNDFVDTFIRIIQKPRFRY